MAVSLALIPRDGDWISRTYLEGMLDTGKVWGLGPESFRAQEVGLVQSTSQSLPAPYLVRYMGPFPHATATTQPLAVTVAARGYDTQDFDYRLFGWRAHALADRGFLAPALRTQVTLTGTSASHLGTPMRPGVHREWAVVPDYSLQKYVTWRLPSLSPHTMRNASTGSAFPGGRKTLTGPRGAFLDSKFVAVADFGGDAVNLYIADNWAGHTSLTALRPIGPASGSGDAQLNGPSDVLLSDPGFDDTEDRHRHVIIADTGNHRLSVWWIHFRILAPGFDPSVYERTWFKNFGSYGTGEGKFDGPVSVAALQNRIFVCDRANNRLARVGFWADATYGSPVSLWWDGSIGIPDPVCVRASPRMPYLIVTSGSTGKLYRVNGWSLSMIQEAIGAGTAVSLLYGPIAGAEYSLAKPTWAPATLPVFAVESDRPRLTNWTPFRDPVPRGAIVRLEAGVDLRSTNYTLGYFTATARFRDLDGYPHVPIAVLDSTAATEGIFYPVTLFGLTRVLALPTDWLGEDHVDAGAALYWRGRDEYLRSWYGSATHTHQSMPAGLFAGWALETRYESDTPNLIRAHFWPYCRLALPAVGWNNYPH